MKIAVVCDVLGKENNGTTIAAMNLIRSLRKKGHEVRVVCSDADKKGRPGYYVMPGLNLGPLNGYVAKNGVVISALDKKVLEDALHDVDIVHVMIPFTVGSAAAKYAHRHGIPLTAGFHCQAGSSIFPVERAWLIQMRSSSTASEMRRSFSLITSKSRRSKSFTRPSTEISSRRSFSFSIAFSAVSISTVICAIGLSEASGTEPMPIGHSLEQ
ncbi:MAG: glycosyltransferase [Lachnospiraceae bacterium]|nr:glycosyltransferase [Lachnospiraceae bacterium]